MAAVVTPRFGESIPGLPEWLAQHYLGLHAQSETFVYFAPKGNLSETENITPISNGDFGGLVQLVGIHLGKQPWNGNRGYISLLWQLQSPIKSQIEYTITLRGADNQTHRFTRLPFAGKFNPANWQIGQQVRDTFKVDLPPNLPPGSYDVYLSLCPRDTGQCLAANNQTEIHLGQLTLQE